MARQWLWILRLVIAAREPKSKVEVDDCLSRDRLFILTEVR